MADSDGKKSPDPKAGGDVAAANHGDSHSEQVGDIHYAYADSRKIGITGSVFLILNKMIGTGIFSTPSGIFAATGSVGVSLILWVIGGIITFAGLSVYLEFGLAIPAPAMLLLGFSSGNSLAFGRYVLYAAGVRAGDTYQARGIGVACVTFAVVLHSVAPKWGIRLLNVLGVFKVVVLLFIVFSGFAALAGHRRVPDPENFKNAFDLSDADRYKGWENANYVLSEVKNPRRTLAIAAPLAIGLATVLYVLANIAYFAAIPKDALVESDVIVAGLFFTNMFGDSAGARTLPVFVSLSNLGNVLAVSFAHARLNQELGKEGLLPASKFWASNKPFNAPAASVTYNFIVDLYTYPGAIINIFVPLGLLWLHYKKSENWTSPWHTYLPIIILFILSNVFLTLVPFIPPNTDWNAEGYPYYVFPVVGWGVLLLGVAYWVGWTKIWPKIGGYRIIAERTIDEDGAEVVRYKKVDRYARLD
ncbi:unnamed protein product [Parascedosporium putredinis]|uniref:High affinity methionine permease n=1 Tax=Parascedosporium putredinis TaxID=1442378 RepID=A0A9P1H599_9PEZI|nr:unnamed protein product [Parascedosporium putredinis]CAI7996185.1 unnamed protein product [Parascedosporium putredinis]